MFDRATLRRLALVCGLIAAGCVGNAQDDSSFEDRDTTVSTDQQADLACAPPRKLVCIAIDGKIRCNCVDPPLPPVQRFQLTPNYLITHVVYAPPGRSSNINYSASSTVGTTTSATKGFKNDTKVTAEVSGNFFLNPSLSVTGGRTSATSRTDALEVTETLTQGSTTFGQVDGIDHNYDEIHLLIRPLLDVTFQPAGQLPTQKASISWKFAAGDGINNDIPYYVYAGWLNSPASMPGTVRNTLDFYGVTQDQYTTLLAADPLFTGVAPGQLMDPGRFEFIGDFPYEPPFAAGDQPNNRVYGVSRKTTSTSTSTSEVSYSVGFTASVGYDISLFKAKLTVSSNWTWTNSSSTTMTAGTGTTEVLTVGQPAFGYGGPTILRVWEDKLYKTYAFTLDWPQGESNLALGKQSWQSTILAGWDTDANRANDGNTDGNFWNGSVNHTDYGFVYGMPDWPGQFWYVDLGSERIVNSVNIFNRTDCCTERLSHYNILAYDSMTGEWKVIANHANDDTTSTSFLHLPTTMTKTEWVMLAKTDENYLHVAEVQVMGF